MESLSIYRRETDCYATEKLLTQHIPWSIKRLRQKHVYGVFIRHIFKKEEEKTIIIHTQCIGEAKKATAKKTTKYYNRCQNLTLLGNLLSNNICAVVCLVIL